MTGAQLIIQRPHNVRLDKIKEIDLQNYMGISDDIFDLFKDIIEEYAIQRLPCVPKSRQKPNEWDDFLSTVNNLLPLQGEYVDNWHIVAYFYILRKDLKIQRRWRLAREESKAALVPSLPKRKVKYVGKSPPSRRVLTSPEKERQPVVKAVSNSPPPLAQRDLSRPSRTQQILSPMSQVLQINYPAPCTTCGFLPPVAPCHSRGLRKFFVDAEDLIPILNFIGVLHDRQLLMVLNWPPADRIAFINTLSPDQVKPADKQRLILILTGEPHTSSSSSVRPPNKSRRERPYDPIPKPSLDAEQHLTSPDTPLSELMQATTIQNAREFDEILQTIDRIYGEYDEISNRDNQWWIQFCLKVYSEWPVMRLYQEAGPEENNWAIKFYLRRKLRGGIRLLPTDPPTTIIRQDERHIVSGNVSPEVDLPCNPDSNGTQAYPYPGITLSTCPAHYPPDHRLVGQGLQHLLESHGSEELLPAFITVGIKTDQALMTLSQSIKQDRIKPFRMQPNLRLTNLQNFVLQIILDRL